jgi:E3 ubiquitin-protein ligase RAD18
MATSSEVTDPSDWLGTPLAALESLDLALRCQVCKEFLNSPMITTCAHTFCSLCIRRCLSADSKCPLCRAPDQPNQLRKNNAMEEAVKVFLGARSDILKLGKEATEHPGGGQRKKRKEGGRKRGLQEAEVETNGEATPRKTRARTRREGAGRKETPVVVNDSEDEAHFTESEREETPPGLLRNTSTKASLIERPDDGLVACPICQRRMPEERVFGHLETHDNSKQPSSNAQVFG